MLGKSGEVYIIANVQYGVRPTSRSLACRDLGFETFALVNSATSSSYKMMGRHGSDRTFVEHVLLKCSNVLMARVGFEPSVWSYRTSASTAAGSCFETTQSQPDV